MLQSWLCICQDKFSEKSDSKVLASMYRFYVVTRQNQKIFSNDSSLIIRTFHFQIWLIFPLSFHYKTYLWGGTLKLWEFSCNDATDNRIAFSSWIMKEYILLSSWPHKVCQVIYVRLFSDACNISQLFKMSN
jgi:hypothetical protein